MATKKKRGKRGVKGGDVCRIIKLKNPVFGKLAGQFKWSRFASNGEYIAGSWPETFKRRIDAVKSAKRAQTPCPIEIEGK